MDSSKGSGYQEACIAIHGYRSRQQLRDWEFHKVTGMAKGYAAGHMDDTKGFKADMKADKTCTLFCSVCIRICTLANVE